MTRFVLSVVALSSLSLAVFGQIHPAKAAVKTPKTPQSQGVRNMRQVVLATLIYAGDNDDVLPDVSSQELAKKAASVYTHTPTAFKTLNPKNSVFLFNLHLAGVLTSSIKKPASVPCWYESVAWPDGSRIVSFADSHVKVVPAGDWPKVEKALTMKFKKAPKPKKTNAKKSK